MPLSGRAGKDSLTDMLKSRVGVGFGGAGEAKPGLTSWQSTILSACCAKTSSLTTNLTLICVLSFRARDIGKIAPFASCTDNGRILLVILFPRHMVVVTVSDFQYSWTCNDGLLAALWTAL